MSRENSGGFYEKNLPEGAKMKPQKGLLFSFWRLLSSCLRKSNQIIWYKEVSKYGKESLFSADMCD